jgi:predicted RNase H-like nuclease (RuvC/YqgF family)
MRLLFSGQNTKLKTMNRILTDAARERAQRIEELERRVAQLEQELEPTRKRARELEIRARELEIAASQRAQLLNEKDEELALVRETLTKCLFRNRDLEQALVEISQK